MQLQQRRRLNLKATAAEGPPLAAQADEAERRAQERRAGMTISEEVAGLKEEFANSDKDDASTMTTVMAVAMGPGATAFTRTFLSASSSASDFARPLTPAFEAA